jgi:hypothetical protein
MTFDAGGGAPPVDASPDWRIATPRADADPESDGPLPDGARLDAAGDGTAADSPTSDGATDVPSDTPAADGQGDSALDAI